MKFEVHEGWVNGARRVPSPNCGPRPESIEPDLLVIHNISLPPGEYGGDSIERFFCNCLDWSQHPYFEEIKGMEVSAHMLIKRCGELLQFVSCDERAWHAGVSEYRGSENCNDFSIGVELEGTDEEPYTEAQYDVLTNLSKTLVEHYSKLDADRIVGHSDISPGRKTDPGPAFDWDYYRSTLVAGENRE
jgi:AmpD protein